MGYRVSEHLGTALIVPDDAPSRKATALEIELIDRLAEIERIALFWHQGVTDAETAIRQICKIQLST